MSILHLGKPQGAVLATIPLRFADTLLVLGGRDRICALKHHQRDPVVIGESSDRSRKTVSWFAYASVAIMLMMLVVMTEGWFPTVTTILLAAAAVLVAPVVCQTVVTMNVPPHTFLMTVAIAVSIAFATAIASPVNTLVNTLVMSAGGYRFSDYTKSGVRMQLLLMMTTLLLVPVVFPLR